MEVEEQVSPGVVPTSTTTAPGVLPLPPIIMSDGPGAVVSVGAPPPPRKRSSCARVHRSAATLWDIARKAVESGKVCVGGGWLWGIRVLWGGRTGGLMDVWAIQRSFAAG